MDRFITYDGQLPIYLEDIDFLQDNNSGAIRLLLHSIIGEQYKDTAVILDGVLPWWTPLTKSKWKDKGLVALNGEILPFEGENQENLANDALYFDIKEAYLPEGDRATSSGMDVHCWQKRTAVITSTPKTKKYPFLKAKRLSELVKKKLLHYHSMQVPGESEIRQYDVDKGITLECMTGKVRAYGTFKLLNSKTSVIPSSKYLVLLKFMLPPWLSFSAKDGETSTHFPMIVDMPEETPIVVTGCISTDNYNDNTNMVPRITCELGVYLKDLPAQTTISFDTMLDFSGQFKDQI